MNELTYLRDLIIIFVVAVAVVIILSRFKIPSIAAYILAGVLMGPKSLALINDIHRVEVLAEIGVSLLLFGIGMEFSLKKLRTLWLNIFVGGTVQVVLTGCITAVIVYSMGYDLSTAIFIGFFVSLSSTAIVLRGLEDRGELNAEHGRFALGVLLFQDICVIPMMLVIPILAGGRGSSDVFGSLIYSVLVITCSVLAAYLIVPRLLKLVARTRQRQLFILSVLLICIGVAYAISSSGVSLALGAFIAGLVVGGSEFRHQATADIISFKEVFTSLFFISVGMLLDPGEIMMNIIPILLILAGIILGKMIIVFITGLLMRLRTRAVILASVALAQVGEFSFVLFGAAAVYNLVPEPLMGNLLAAATISMLLTPLAIAAGPHLSAGLGKLPVFYRAMNIKTAEEASSDTKGWENHVIIGGFGFAGRQLAKVLKENNVKYMILELNINTVREVCRDGEPIYFGDVTSRDVLERVGAERARELVVAVNDPRAAERAIIAAKSISPDLHVTVRTDYILDIENLRKLGADDVIPGEQEAAVELVRRVASRYGCDEDRLESRLKLIREEKE
ncbi:MAG: cation:proton antiporter [Candidatus Zixiibacteriota bacterium]|nr:MAG: cation:proton antiporter [candidate division Zixibacteria bacterium]